MIKAHSLEERAPREVIERQASLVRDSGSLNALLDANPSIVLVLNQFRQVVYANQVLARFLKLDELGCVFGMRPGEVLNCVNSDLNPGGCGNSLKPYWVLQEKNLEPRRVREFDELEPMNKRLVNLNPGGCGNSCWQNK